MEKALTKVGSFWISKKARQEFSSISQDISTLSGSVEEKAKWVFNKLKGKPQKSLTDILREHNLPAGLFPQNVKCYEFEEAKGKLTVHMATPLCEVSFKGSSVIRYGNRVKGILSRGKLNAWDRRNEDQSRCVG